MPMPDPSRVPAEFPVALEPCYVTPVVNAPVTLYEGPVEFATGDKTVSGHSATVSLVWLPSPRIELHVVGFAPIEAFVNNEEWTVRIPGRVGPLPLTWSRFSTGAGPGVPPPKFTAILDRPDDPPPGQLRAVRFHVANGPKYLGEFVRNDDRTNMRRARAVMEAKPWRVTLEAVPPWHDGADAQRLRGERGFAITHVGRLEHIDGSPFESADAGPVLRAVGLMLSFCRGAWTHPLLPVAEEADTETPHHVWRVGHVDPAEPELGWFPEFSNEGFDAFPGLFARLDDAVWGEPIGNALHWYIVCNKPGPVSIEGAIVLQQAAFELLAWTLLVEDRRVLSEDGVQKLPASDRIRLMLSACDIPLAIPPGLAELSRVAKDEKWQDGPHATTEIRNAIVHASPKKRARILGHGFEVRTDAWTLGQWYLELILLRLFDYNGPYSNRLRRGVGRGAEVEPVPWAKP